MAPLCKEFGHLTVQLAGLPIHDENLPMLFQIFVKHQDIVYFDALKYPLLQAGKHAIRDLHGVLEPRERNAFFIAELSYIYPDISNGQPLSAAIDVPDI